MNTARSQTTSELNFFALIIDKNFVNEKPKKPSRFLDNTVGIPTWYDQPIFSYSPRIHEKYIAEVYKGTDFVSITKSTRGGTLIYSVTPENMLHTSPVAVIDASEVRVESFISNPLSAHPLVDISSFESIQMSLESLGFSKCAERIKYLHSTDDMEDDKPLSLESAQGFVKLVKDFSDLGEPLLGLFAQGTLSVEWRIADDKHLLVEPLNSERACFAFIGPSTEQGEKLRVNGEGPVMDIIQTLRKSGIDQWQNA